MADRRDSAGSMGGPPPVVSVEAVLDEDTESAIRREWKALAEAGMSSMAAHTAPSNRPHLTLLARTDGTLRAPLDLSSLRLPVEVTLARASLLGDGERRVLARRVGGTTSIRTLHARVHALAGRGDDLPHTGVDDWSPHVTLAKRLRLVRAPDALAMLGGDLEGRIVGIRRWDAAARSVEMLAGGD